MAETRRLRFMSARGYNGVVISRGAVVDITEPWASRFLADGTCVEEQKPEARSQKSEADAEPKAVAKAPVKRKKK